MKPVSGIYPLLAAVFFVVIGSGAFLFAWDHSANVRALGPSGETIMVVAALTAVLSYAAAVLCLAAWRRAQWPPLSIPREHGLKAGVYGLMPGRTYQVMREIKDCYGTVFPVGMRLVFVGRHYLPYHGGHTVVFTPTPMYLQDDENAEVLGHLDDYLEIAGIASLPPGYQPGY